jgi:HK97 family phage prohead protease
MPYYISDKQSDCAGWATIKVVDGNPETITCHTSKQDAIDHMVALSIAEGIEPMGEYGIRAVDTGTYTPSEGTQIAAKRALKWIANGLAGDGFTSVGHNRAKQLASGSPISAETVNKMIAYFARHEVDKQAEGFNAGDKNYPSPGRIAWDAWGGDAGQSWVNGLNVQRSATDLPKNRGSKLKMDTFTGVVMNKRYMGEVETPQMEMAEPTKATLEAYLRDLLGEVVTFKFMAHGFHWNVRGINFSQYHDFFSEIYEDADGSIDPIAENIRKLNFDAPFQLQDFIASDMDVVPTDSTDPLEMCRSLYEANEEVREAIVKALYVANCLAEQGIVNFLAERQDMHSKWQWQLRSIVGDSFANNYEIDVEEVSEAPETDETEPDGAAVIIEDGSDADVNMDSLNGAPAVEMNATATKWQKAAEMILRKLEPARETALPESRDSKIETRINHSDFEMRATGDGMTFEGYASVFDSPSEPIGGRFTEYVAPGAFKRSLQARNDVKLLWNHDTGQVLGSTRAGTLKLVEDSIGLKAIATLPDTQLGRDTATLLKRGDVANMSFGFTVPQGGDSWNTEGNVRTLKSVKLHEVSIVAFPAYQASTASVRSISADSLAIALEALENGSELTEDQANLITDVTTRLTKTTEPAVSILDIQKKKLALQGMVI